ncbi:MAG: T9SS type A sorting domain-containing protein [Candidatus Latescibacterota bacterium]|nr:MAG: T9SS type A sorting domain-containing protein [Candidatus Latescibacterota bacterium]
MIPRTRAFRIFRRSSASVATIPTLTAVMMVSLFVLAGGLRAQANGRIGLLGHLDIPSSAYNTDVWGWVDPETLKEYALVGNNATGLHIVDCSNPKNPIIVSTIDTVPSFDIKTWEHYAFTVDGNYGFAGADGKIIDISDPEHPVVVGTIPPGHNLFVDADGYLYVTFPGLKMFSLRPDPTNPKLVWEKVSTQGHDVTVVGDRLYDFHGYDGTFIYDIFNHRHPVLIGAIPYGGITFHHSGWTSSDEKFLFVNDEMAEHPSPDIAVFDISRPALPIKVAAIADSSATAHNSYRIGNFLHVSYYTAGYRVYDITDPTNPVMADEFDTTPLVGEGIFKGAWGCYPFSPSGCIFINDRPDGFFVFSFGADVTAAEPGAASVFDLEQNFPNPFNPETTIPYYLARESRVELSIYDTAGRRIRRLVDTDRGVGPHRAVWDSRNDHGHRVASGVYFYRLEIDGFVRSHKMVLLR